MRLIVLALAALLAGVVQVQARDSAKEMVTGCRDYVGVRKGVVAPERGDILAATECVATIETLFKVSEILDTNFRFCRPDGVTVNDGVELVVQEIEARPKMGHFPFVIMAIGAFQKRWPCQ
jgi:Ssp1 endopeptidase immunity protein Rap1a